MRKNTMKANCNASLANVVAALILGVAVTSVASLIPASTVVAAEKEK